MTSQDTRWMSRGLCVQSDPDLFFPEQGAGPGKCSSPDAAQRICGACPVRDQCLAYAIKDPPLRGVWGGLTDYQRLTVRKRIAA